MSVMRFCSIVYPVNKARYIAFGREVYDAPYYHAENNRRPDGMNPDA